MERAQTPILGITTTSAYEEGSTCSLVNLRPKNGALHPVSPRKVEQELSQKYDIIFIHQNNDYQNWIGVINTGDTSSIYWDIKNEPRTIKSDIPGPVNSVQQIGNTLSLITGDSVYYLLYREDAYTFLGEIPEIPMINMSGSTSLHHSGTLSNLSPSNGFEEQIKAKVNQLMNELVNGYTENGEAVEGNGALLFDAHFVRYAFRLYDGSLTKHSPPILVIPTTSIGGLKTAGFRTYPSSTANVDVAGYRLGLTYDFQIGGNWESWKDVIQSVDIFMSAPTGLSSIENIRKDIPKTFREWLGGLIEITSDMIRIVKDTSSFYLIKSIPLGSKISSPEYIPAKDLEFTTMDNLIYQEVMTDDNFTHHKYGAGASYAYNNRLHLANLKTTFFKGFSSGYFQWNSEYGGRGTSIDFDAEMVVAEVDIHTGSSIEKVYSFYGDGIRTRQLFASAFISYPDTRARKITFYEVRGGVWQQVFTANLQAHNFLNLAYYLHEEIGAIMSPAPFDPDIVPTPDTSKIISIFEPNKIKVSELNNPLYFPNTNTYQAGTGSILAMATNAMNVSDRNYGQYPLYIFTTRGVFTLNVGDGEVVYSALSAPTYADAPTTNIVGETPYGVVFTTQRGLMLINGQSAQFISPQIEQVPVRLNMETNAHCDGVVFLAEVEKFSETLKGLSGLIYNPYENELIVSIPNRELNFVLNFDASSFYQSTEKIDTVVGNAYPELLVVGDNKLKDYAYSDSPLTHISFITRPLKFGTSDIKRFERMILRTLIYGAAKFDNGKFPLFMVHYSMDRINFKALTGYPIPNGNNKDLDSRLMSRSKFSYALFTMAGLMNEETVIEYLDTVFENEYANTKMR